MLLLVLDHILSMKRYTIESTVFIIGASIMILELTASRILAPYVGTSELYTFNKIGRRIFELALSGMSERDIVKEIVKDYDVTQKKATEDVTSFLKVLYKKKLLK